MMKHRRFISMIMVCSLLLPCLILQSSAIEPAAFMPELSAEGVSTAQAMEILSNRPDTSRIRAVEDKVFFILNGNTLAAYSDTQNKAEILYQSGKKIGYYLTDGDMGAMVGDAPPKTASGTAYWDPSPTPGLSWSGNYSYVNFATGAVHPVDDPKQTMEILNRSLRSKDGVSYTTTINGKPIPMPNYPNGTHYGGECDDCFQCMGFGLEVLEYLYGSTSLAPKYDIPENVSASRFVDKYKPGTYMRLRQSAGGEHSLIYIGCDRKSETIYVYHSNWDGNDTVYVSSFSYANFNDTFSYLEYVRYHTHDFSSWKGTSSQYHTRTCSTCNYTDRSPHVFDDSVRKCLVCGMSMPFRDTEESIGE